MMCCVSRGMASTTECKTLPRPPAYPPHFATCTHTCTHTYTTTFSSVHRVQICKTALDTHPPFSLSRAIIHTWWAFDLSLASAASAIAPTPAPRANGVGSTGERQWAGLLISWLAAVKYCVQCVCVCVGVCERVSSNATEEATLHHGQA